jgi:hypothetical protein
MDTFPYEDVNGTVLDVKKPSDGRLIIRVVVYGNTPLESRSVPVVVAASDVAAFLDGLAGKGGTS